MRQDRDLPKELDSHPQLHIDDNIRAGMTPEEARRQALLTLGGIAQTRERVNDVRRWHWIDDLRDDLRYALRTLRRSPGFAVTAIGVIALGIAATTAAFTVLDYMLLRPLPFPEPGRLVRIYQSDVSRNVPRLEASPPNFTDWKSGTTSFSARASFLFGGSSNVTGRGEPRQVD